MESVVRSYIGRLNAKDWEGMLQYCAFPLTFNGAVQDAAAHLAELQRVGQTFPSHRIDVDFMVVGTGAEGDDDDPSHKATTLVGVRSIVTAHITAAGKARFGLEPTGADTDVRVQDLWLVRLAHGAEEGGKPALKEIYTAVDGGPMVAQLRDPPPTLPDLSSESIRAQVGPAKETHDLEKIIREWASHAAAKRGAAHAPRFFHEKIYHWSKGLISREEAAADLDGVLSVFGDVDMEIAGMAVDAERQLVVVRYVLRTVLVKPFGGIQPNGRRVAIPEICFYQFAEGRIFANWAVVDMMSFREQMA